MQRIWAIIERDMRKFFRSPALMMSSMIFPLMQLVILGNAFGGKIKHVDVAVVDEDHGSEARRVRELFAGIENSPRTFVPVYYDSIDRAVRDLRSADVHGVIYIPEGFSRRVGQQNRPRIGFIVDNTDNFLTSALQERMVQLTEALNKPKVDPRLVQKIQLEIVELYPYIEYMKYLLPGSISLSIFVVAMIAGGITFIDDKARGLHEGYLITPIKRSELVLGLILAGAIKGVMAGMVLTVIGSLLAGIPRIYDPVRLLYLVLMVGVTSAALISFMFLLMVRVSDPLVPRAIFGVLNTLLFFPSGAIYPTQGFPTWLKWISVADPFTYAVHGLKNLLLKNTGLVGIYSDLIYLLVFSVVMAGTSVLLFERQV